MSLILPLSAAAEAIRIVSFNAGLSRKGPGLLVRDLLKGEDPQIAGIVARIVALGPDILVLQSFDYDHDGVALSLFKDRLRDVGHDMSYHFAARPNSGTPTGFDLDRDGRYGMARDAQGYGLFSGQGGLAILSRFPIDMDAVQDFSTVLWKDLPDARWPLTPKGDYYSEEEKNVLRLHNVAAWDVPVLLPSGPVYLLVSQAGPPVFDGPEDRNGLRNGDEIAFWTRYIAGDMFNGQGLRSARFVLAAGLNNDPQDGDGLKPTLDELLGRPELIDPEPRSEGAALAADPDHLGDPGLDTVDWGADPGPGNLRVSYILPSVDFEVVKSGVHWPTESASERTGTPHRPVWVDLQVRSTAG